MTTDKNTTTVALAIVGIGALIALILFISLRGGTTAPSVDESLEPLATPAALRYLSDTDHVYGDSDAVVTIIEFSDYECPFCAQLHPTLKTIVDSRDDVNWVYRHYPLTSFHTRAYASAHASECVAELAGNDAFWAFSDALFAQQQQLSDDLYRTQATQLGVNAQAFDTCMESDRHRTRIEADLAEVQNVGGQGTPYVVVVNNEQKEGLPFSGALPQDTITAVVDAVRF